MTDRRKEQQPIEQDRRQGDRRIAPRVSLPVPVEVEYPGRTLATASLNVSTDGGFVHIDPPHEEGVILHLLIALPNRERVARLEARTVSRVTEGEHPGNGVRFLNLDAATGAALEELTRA